MKKLLSILLILMVSSTVAVFAVGQYEEGVGKRTVVFDSRLWTPPHEQEYVINEVLVPFGRENNCIVSFSIIDDDTLLKRAKLQKETNNVTTDLVIAYCARFNDWVKGGYIEDLTSYVRSWTDRSFAPGINSMAVINGRQYFIPIASDVYLLCANKKALKYLPAGADVQDLTWEEFADWAVAMARGEGEGKVAVTGVPEKALIYQVGGIALSYGAGFPDVSSSGAVKAWEIMVKMRNAFTPTVMTYDSLVAPMKRGEAWLTWAHVANVGEIYGSNPAQYVIAPVPGGPAGKGSIAGTQGFAIPKGSPNKDLAVKLIEYITRPGMMLKIAKGAGGWIPPVSEAVAMLGDTTQDEVIKKAIDVMDHGKLSFIPPAYTGGGNWGKIKHVYDDIANKFLESGRVDTGYLRTMQNKIEGYK